MRNPNRRQAKSGVSSAKSREKARSTNTNSNFKDQLTASESAARVRVARRIVRVLAVAIVSGLVRRPDAVKALALLKIGGE